MTSFATTLYDPCCRRHVVGQQVISDVTVVRNCWSINCSLCSESNYIDLLPHMLIAVLRTYILLRRVCPTTWRRVLGDHRYRIWCDTLLIGHRTCDVHVAGSNPGWAPLRMALPPCASYLHTCASVTKQYNLVPAKGGGCNLFGWDRDSNRRPGGNNGSLPPGLNVTCGLTAKKPGSTLCPTLVIEYWTTLLFTPYL